MDSNLSSSAKPLDQPPSATVDSSRDSETSTLHWPLLLFTLMILTGLPVLAWNLLPNLSGGIYGTMADGTLNIEQETLRIADDLQCPVCEGQSVAYSNSQLANEMRRQVMEKLLAGENEATIKQFFIDRYGVRVLREPPRTGLNLWLWRLPTVGLLIGIVGLIWNLRHMARNQQARDAIPSTDAETSVESTNDDLLDPAVKELLVQYDRDLFQS
ncbi:MAG: cytochrome c-type biogenesis protein CcmH [Caldilineaceae bacterium]|nr:cytochrome c-type biogenesis protein CcmH [Caldilineaceae bacterium]MCB0184595.1 cytochrome c-type biogenesis protein CcmH [Caldilineaceae bacterium]